MKIKSILISQPKPVDITKTPYDNIIKKFNVNIEFEKFIRLEDVSASELRQDKIKLSDYTAIILTSRNTVDHFFRIAKEMRYTIPDELKYFVLQNLQLYTCNTTFNTEKEKYFSASIRLRNLLLS